MKNKMMESSGTLMTATSNLTNDDFMPSVTMTSDVNGSRTGSVVSMEDWLVTAAADGDIGTIHRILDSINTMFSERQLGAALLEAAKYGKSEVVKLFLDLNADHEVRDHNGDSALMAATRKDHPAIVQQLVNHGVNIEAEDMAGVTPFQLAVRKDHNDVVQILLDKSPNIETMNNIDRIKLLILSVKSGRANVVSTLLDKGCYVDIKDKDGNTLLHMACRRGSTDVARVLLSRGAYIESRNKDGRTPLLEATYHDHQEVIKLLLRKGANIKAKDKRGKTAYMVASNVRVQRILSSKVVPSRCVACIHRFNLDNCAIHSLQTFYGCTFLMMFPPICASYLCFHNCSFPSSENEDDDDLNSCFNCYIGSEDMVFWACCGRNPWAGRLPFGRYNFSDSVPQIPSLPALTRQRSRSISV